MVVDEPSNTYSFDTTFTSVNDTLLLCTDTLPAIPIVEPFDDCGNAVIINFTETATGTTICDSTITRAWTIEDECGNDTIFTQILAFRDTTPPTIFGVPDDIQIECTDCIQSFLNGNMETPALPGAWSYVDASAIPGWSTTATDNLIEFQRSGSIDGVVSYEGNQHAELNGTQNSDFYQEFCTVPTTTLQISFAHHKRMGSVNTTDDIMEVLLGQIWGH